MLEVKLSPGKNIAYFSYSRDNQKPVVQIIETSSARNSYAQVNITSTEDGNYRRLQFSGNESTVFRVTQFSNFFVDITYNSGTMATISADYSAGVQEYSDNIVRTTVNFSGQSW